MGYESYARALTRGSGIGFGETTADNRFTVLPIVCLGACDHAPAMIIDDDLYRDVDPAENGALWRNTNRHAMEKPLTNNIPTDESGRPTCRPTSTPVDTKDCVKLYANDAGGSPRPVEKSNLRGRGGAGFPTGKKWSFVPMGKDAPQPKYLVANADEMEPGTFKDRLLMEGDPHQLIEGMIIAAYAIQADVAYIFLRQEYKLSERRLRKALAEAYENNYLGKNVLGSDYCLEMHLHVSAGRYMCGEETGCSTRSKESAPIPVPNRRFPKSPACGASRPSCKMSRRSETCLTSSTTAPLGSRA